MEAIGVVASGRTQQQIKQAIRSTHGTRIRSTFALKNAYGKHLKGRERGYGLYSEYVFFDELMPDDEKTADKNFVWLADWYLANINSLYCSPLNHGLWLALDNASPIASRMYEFFTFNFAGDWRTLTIDYDKLRRFLPVAPEKHLSQIKKQLGKALGFVVEAGVLAEANWQQGKRGQAQLVVVRGPILAKKGPATEWVAEPDELDATEIRDLYRQNRPEDELVSQFHSLWEGNDQYQATSTDRARAKEVLTAYGSRHAEKLLPLVVELLREHFPKAKSFGATARYWSDAHKTEEHTQAAGDRRKQDFIDHQLAAERRRLLETRREQLDETWSTLPEDEQQAIRDQVLASHPPSMKLEKYPRTLHNFCLEELGKRTAAARP